MGTRIAYLYVQEGSDWIPVGLVQLDDRLVKEIKDHNDARDLAPTLISGKEGKKKHADG